MNNIPLRKKLVDRIGEGTNPPILVDFITFSPNPYDVNPSKLRDFYLHGHLTAAQIAERLGCSKATVLGRLKQAGVRERKGRSTHPDNYRLATAPYGFKVRDGKLVPCRKELQVCRLIVDLRERRHLSFHAIGGELAKRKFKNRRGETLWHHHTLSRIFSRWKEKL